MPLGIGLGFRIRATVVDNCALSRASLSSDVRYDSNQPATKTS